jgi:UTP--glucose-1-phosphate uridylyltransferase
MKIRKAVITAAAPSQRTLPLQSIIDRDGTEKAILAILLEEALSAGVEEICVVVAPGATAEYASAAGVGADVRFLEQSEPRGYGHALLMAAPFVAGEPFLHLVGDHLYVHEGSLSCARHLVNAAVEHRCAVSSVQATRENLVPRFGTIGGKRLAGHDSLYRVERVVEKPTPTEAEQSLIVPGMRVGHYLCFFGMHVFTPTVLDLVAAQLRDTAGPVGLSPALHRLAQTEQYLAAESPGRRYDIGARYGLLRAQLALALSGRDRAEVLSHVLEVAALAASRG